MVMKILLANPPAYLYDDRRHFIQGGSRWSFSFQAEKNDHRPHYQPYPFSLGYALSLLKDSMNIEVTGLDACALNFDEKDFIRAVTKNCPDILVIEVPTISYPLVVKMLEGMDATMTQIIICGPHVTALSTPHQPEQMFVLPGGRWEERLLDHIRFTWGRFVPRWTGIRFKDYPHCDREYFQNGMYRNFESNRPTAQMIASRGCAMNCSFCLERHVQQSCVQLVEKRRIEDVVDEMEELESQGIKHIHFDDMSLTHNKKYVMSLCEEIRERKLNLVWTCLGDMLADEETIREMSKAFCIGLAFGVETINRATLNNINKSWVNQLRARRFTKILRQYGIQSVATFSLGLPYETAKTLMKTVDFACGDLKADSVQFSIATPYPGTPFFKQCKREGWLITQDWTQYDGARNCVIDTPWLKHKDVEALYQWAMNVREEKGLGMRK